MRVSLRFVQAMVEWTGTFKQFPFQEITREPNGHFTSSQASTTNAADVFCKFLNQFGGQLWYHERTCARDPSRLIASQVDKRHYHYTLQNWNSEDDKNMFDQLYEQMRNTPGTCISCNGVYSPRGLKFWLEKHTGCFCIISLFF